MKNINDGGPVFPCTWVNDSDVNATAPNGEVVPPGGKVYLNGTSLRDYFAAKALQGILANGGILDGGRSEDIDTQTAFQYADRMLAVRERTR